MLMALMDDASESVSNEIITRERPGGDIRQWTGYKCLAEIYVSS